MKEILKRLCEIYTMYNQSFFTCTGIAKELHMSVNNMRQHMKELIQEGYIVKGNESGYDCTRKCPFYISGYHIMPKIKECEYYEEAQKKDEQFWSHYFEDNDALRMAP